MNKISNLKGAAISRPAPRVSNAGGLGHAYGSGPARSCMVVAMRSMIETLLDNPVVRPDNVRLVATRRPAPMRPRELFEVFGVLGVSSSYQGLIQSLDFKLTSPGLLANAVLSRWLTNAELAAVGQPYKAPMHLRELLLSYEFRGTLIRRVCEAFPEKRRMLHVRIPSCAGRYTMAVLQTTYPTFRNDYASREFGKVEYLAKYLGVLLSAVNTARAVAISTPQLTSFIDPPALATVESDPLGWAINPAPCRAQDLLFTVVRPPVSLALSQVNATLTRLRMPDPPPALQSIARALGPLPAADQKAAWQALGRKLLASHLPQNPICTALGTGTADSAFAACARVPIQIVGIDRYCDWCRTAFEGPPYEATDASEPFLQEADLTAADRATINARMAEDIIFYNRFQPLYESGGLPWVPGPKLQG